MSNYNLELLESVDVLIKNNERLQTDLLWSRDYDPMDQDDTLDPNVAKLLDRIQGDLDHLYRLRDKGIIYEPLF